RRDHDFDDFTNKGIFARKLSSSPHNSRLDGRRGMAMTIAASIMARAAAALRALTVRWYWVWLDSASNHSTVTSAGVQSHSARRHAMGAPAAAWRASASAISSGTITPTRLMARKNARSVAASGNR